MYKCDESFLYTIFLTIGLLSFTIKLNKRWCECDIDNIYLIVRHVY
jgi:hypothetical protein